jgi:anti-sigma regulatory factor (Ser/Thr protein kinase)
MRARFEATCASAAASRAGAAATRERARRLRLATLRSVLPADQTCGSVARMRLDDRFAHHTAAVLDDLKMVVSKLASNAYRKGAGDIELRVREGVHYFHVDVIDRGDSLGLERRELRCVLGIVGQLASNWGSGPGGNHVWAHVQHEGSGTLRGAETLSVPRR